MTAEINAEAPITISVDLESILRGLIPSGRYDQDGDPLYGGTVGDRVAQLAADQLAKELREDVRTAVQASISARVDDIVRQTLDEGVRRTDPWGQPQGEPTTVATLIRKEVEDYLTKESGDYRSRQTRLSKAIHELVDRQFTTELKKAVEQGKTEVLAAVKDKAAEVVAETIARAAR